MGEPSEFLAQARMVAARLGIPPGQKIDHRRARKVSPKLEGAPLRGYTMETAAVLLSPDVRPSDPPDALAQQALLVLRGQGVPPRPALLLLVRVYCTGVDHRAYAQGIATVEAWEIELVGLRFLKRKQDRERVMRGTDVLQAWANQGKRSFEDNPPLGYPKDADTAIKLLREG